MIYTLAMKLCRTVAAVAALVLTSGCATVSPAPTEPAPDLATAESPVEVGDAAPRVDATPAVKAKRRGPQPGEVAPGLAAVQWFRGAAPAAGEPYLLFFWGTWCKPCKVVVPETLAYAEARGLQVIAVSRDSTDNLEAFIADWATPFPHHIAYEHPRYPMHIAYDAFSVPRIVEVGGDGLVAAVHYGVVGIEALETAAR